MRTILFLALFALIISASFASANTSSFEHEIPTGVIKGEKARIEVMAIDTDHTIYDMSVFYRELGDENYKQLPMKPEGTIYSANINTSSTTTGQIEYYIAYEGGLGKTGSLPEVRPQLNPYVLRIAPAKSTKQTANFEIVILSPLPEDVLAENEVLIAASFLGGETEIDYSLSKLFIDEDDVTPAAQFGDGIVTYIPNRMMLGRHIIELQLYDNAGELLLTEEWAFRVVKSEVGIPGLNITGALTMDNRNQRVSNSNANFFRGGGHLSGNLGDLDFYSRVLFSSEEANSSQPVNRYTGELRYNLSERNYMVLNGGDFLPYYNPLLFQDKRVRGVQAGLALGFFTFDLIYGQTYRSVEGSLDINEDGDTLQVNGTHSENIMAIRPGIRFGDNVHWRLNLVNSKEDEHSIKYGGNVKETLIVGTDLSMNFDRRRVLFEASVQTSIKNSDAGGPELEFEELVEIDSSLADNSRAEQAFNLLKNTGFLSATAGLNLYPSLAMQFDLLLKYFNNYLKLTYLNIASEFESPGNPYLLKDIAGFYFADNVRLFKNQVFLNLFFKKYKNNITNDAHSTNNTEFGSTISYFPFRNFPSLTLGYENYSRHNNVTEQESSLYNYLYMEDNKTQRFSIASSYDLNVHKIRNTISVSVSNYLRDDTADKESNGNFNSVTVSLRTKFHFPLTTKMSYSQSGTSYGDTSKTTTDLKRFNFRLEYELRNLLNRDVLRPFINLSFQNIDSKFTAMGSTITTRNNYSGGLVYQSSAIGRFILRFDQITYTVADEDITDRVINARYEINF